MRVFDKQKLIGNLALLPFLDQFTLHRERLFVSDASAMAHLAFTH
jgi:hypothetical protein